MPTMPRIKTIQLVSPPTWVIRLEGEHDLATADRIRDVLGDALRSRDPVVVDLTRVTFVKSTVLGRLLMANELAGRRGLALVVVSGSQVDRLFDLVSARATLRVFPTLQRAVEWVNSEEAAPV